MPHRLKLLWQIAVAGLSARLSRRPQRLAIFAGAAGIPNGELVDLDTGDGFDLFGDESGQLLGDHELCGFVGSTCGGDDGLEAFGAGFELGQRAPGRAA